VSFWTDIIVCSPTWVDVYPEKVRRFIATVAGGSSGDAEHELACYGILDINGEARRQAAKPDMEVLLKKLMTQARRAEQIDCDASGVYEPPSWTEMSDTHIGPFFSAEGPVYKICQQLLAAERVPFAELEIVGLQPSREILSTLSFCGNEAYLEISELNFEVGPNLATYLHEPPEFAGWLRIALSGEGQPFPLTKAQMIARAQASDAFRRIIEYATECFGVKEWRWTISSKE